MTQISELLKVHLDFMKCMTDFENDQKQKVGGTFYLGVKREHLLNDFKHNLYFQDFQAIWGDKYTGYLCNPHTDISKYLADTTHFGIIISNMLLQMILKLLGQPIESKHAGLGSHAVASALTFAVSGSKSW